MKKYFFEGTDIKKDIKEKYGYEGDLAKLFADNEGTRVNRWHHYLPLYEQYFAKYRGTPVRFLEIGVYRGGSLSMWRNYLGKEATIFGIDIVPDCAAYDGKYGQVRIGSQDDPEFLASVVEEMGGIDVVLDDGSHRMEHVRASLTALYQKLEMGGTYMIEDLHTAYYRGFSGGFRGKGNFFLMVRDIIDDMHHWYHAQDIQHPNLLDAVSGIHVHDSIVVLDKNQCHRPTFSLVPK